MDLALYLNGIFMDAKYEEIRNHAAGNPATDSSIPPRDGSCPWNLLPRELRDEIFRYAYGRRSGGLKIIFKTEIDLYNERDKSTWLGDGDSRRVSLIFLARGYLVHQAQYARKTNRVA